MPIILTGAGGPSVGGYGNIVIDGGSLSLTNRLNIVRDNLLFHLDAGNSNSYNGSGTTWYDISGNGNNATLEPDVSSNYPGFVSNGDSSYFTFTGGTEANAEFVESIDVTGYSTLTIDVWFWEDDNGGRIAGGGDRDLIKYVPDGVRDSTFTLNSTGFGGLYFRTDGDGNSQSRFNNSSIQISEATWYRFCYTTDSFLWIDETKFTCSSGCTDDTFDGPLQFGQTRGVNYALDGRIAHILVYDGALTDAEIQQNYDALSSRYI